MIVRCCLCKGVMDFEDKMTIQIRYENIPVEYAVCKKCYNELRNSDLVDLYSIWKGDKEWSKNTEQSQ